MDERACGESYTFLIWDKSSSALVGSTRYCAISNNNKRVEIGGTWLTKAYQGSGINKAVKYELLCFAFDTLLLNRVELKTDVINAQSRKGILKIGAKKEGILRSYQITPTGRVRDSIYFIPFTH